MDTVVKAFEELSSNAASIQTAVLTIMGVVVTIGLGWAIVKGMQR